MAYRVLPLRRVAAYVVIVQRPSGVSPLRSDDGLLLPPESVELPDSSGQKPILVVRSYTYMGGLLTAGEVR